MDLLVIFMFEAWFENSLDIVSEVWLQGMESLWFFLKVKGPD